MSDTAAVADVTNGASGELRARSYSGAIPGWDLVSFIAWTWYAENTERPLVVVRKWIFHFTVRVRDVRPLFVVLFGAQPPVPHPGEE